MAVMTTRNGGKLPSETLAWVPTIACATSRAIAVDDAGDEPAVGAAPAVLVLEAGDEATDGDERGEPPVGAAGDPDEHAGDGAEDRRESTPPLTICAGRGWSRNSFGSYIFPLSRTGSRTLALAAGA